MSNITGTMSAFGKKGYGPAGCATAATPAICVPSPALAVRTRTA